MSPHNSANMKQLILNVFICVLSLLTLADITPNQKQSLIDLYQSTNGESWNTKWDLSAEVSTWHSVTVENDNMVAIQLSFNNLAGKLPQSIASLSYLKVLDLSFNSLKVNYLKIYSI